MSSSKSSGISIHAPREGGDRYFPYDRLFPWEISIHAPREGGDPSTSSGLMTCGRFQSTPPARGATLRYVRQRGKCGISIHAPREGGDQVSRPYPHKIALFQSTPPARGATQGRNLWAVESMDFNPRPPRGGRRQQAYGGGRARKKNFNPRPPRGGRRQKPALRILRALFQSTPPARGATSTNRNRWSKTQISIHAPREGGDVKLDLVGLTLIAFQSTPPARGATGRYALRKSCI